MRNEKGRSGRPRLGITPQAAGVFVLSLLICTLLIVTATKSRMDNDRYSMEQIILEKSLLVSDSVSRLLYKTQALAALVVQSDGEIQNFEKVAQTILDDEAILNVLVAPGGVVQEIYPPEERAVMLGFDFFSDMAGNTEAQFAVDKGELVVSGPFLGAQQREILSGRLPVWLDNADGSRRFWGIVSVTLKYPEALAGAGLDSLEKQGLAYEIWRVNPDDGQRQIIASSPYAYDTEARYIEKKISILNADWYFRLSPLHAWYQLPETWMMCVAALALCFFAAAIVESNSRLKRMKQSLEKQESASRLAAQSAQEASRMKSTFLATVSHEIRTPMNGIIGYSGLAMEDAALAPATREYLLNIERSAKGLMQIINDLLDISKIEAGKVELECIPFSLQKVFEECFSINSPKAMEKGIELRILAGEAAGAWLLGDPTRLRQILLNLLSNAIKFTGVGLVEMRCQLLQESREECQLLFSVKDTGIGLSHEQIARIGESFTQADSSTTRKYGGTGLGLSISQNLIRLMGGQLAIDSAPNVGSRFSFSLNFPKCPAPAEEPEEAPALRRPVFQGEALVCEDNPVNQALAEEHLRRAGLAVSLAENGREGVALVRRRMAEGRPFDIIFMDVQMPVMDGLTAAQELAGLGCTTPVVAMTANVMESDREAYRQAGMGACLAKPFTAEELRACLLAHLPLAGWEAVEAPPGGGPRRGTVLHRDLGLRVTDGDEAWYQRLLLRFVDEHADVHKKIEAALRRGDSKQAGRLAHSLKGVGNMIGAVRLSAAAARVEEAIGREHQTGLDEQMGLLAEELNAVLEELQPQQETGRAGHADSHL